MWYIMERCCKRCKYIIIKTANLRSPDIIRLSSQPGLLSNWRAVFRTNKTPMGSSFYSIDVMLCRRRVSGQISGQERPYYIPTCTSGKFWNFNRKQHLQLEYLKSESPCKCPCKKGDTMVTIDDEDTDDVNKQ
eukprot:jgi/Bigna1/77380/fgenesh1_pg.47_\